MEVNLTNGRHGIKKPILSIVDDKILKRNAYREASFKRCGSEVVWSYRFAWTYHHDSMPTAVESRIEHASQPADPWDYKVNALDKR